MASAAGPVIKQNLPMFTVQGPCVAWCMLHGHKPCETRSVNTWKPGWYGLHVGKSEVLDAEVLQALEIAAQHIDLPAAEALLHSAIVGCVKLGPAVDASNVDHYWCLKGFGHFAYPIEASLIFDTPIVDIMGALGIWRVQDPQLLHRVQEAAGRAALQDYSESPAVLSILALPQRGGKRPSSQRRCFVLPPAAGSSRARIIKAPRQTKFCPERRRQPSRVVANATNTHKD